VSAARAYGAAQHALATFTDEIGPDAGPIAEQASIDGWNDMNAHADG